MDTLPKTIESAGFMYEQLQREGLRAIYAQKRRGTVISFEVIVIKQLPKQTIMGRDYEEREAYPRGEDWGYCAWSCATLERARERFDGLAVNETV